VLEAERRHLLRRGWHYVGDATPVAEPGAFLTATVGGTPLVVTRDAEGALHGLVNVCRHRGAPVATGCGAASGLSCRYHGWSYHLDGRVRGTVGTPVPDGVALPRVWVDTVGPLLFVSYVEPDRSVRDELGPLLRLIEDVSHVDLTTITRRGQRSHSIRGNWKTTVENFIECYHCPLVHPVTLPGYGRDDYVVVTHDRLQTQQLEADRFTFGYLFPDTQISVYGNNGAIVVRQLVATGVDRTDVRLDFWFAPMTTDDAVQEWIDFFETVIAEDEPLIEAAQRGLATGSLDHGWLHPGREKGLVHFQQLIRSGLEPHLDGR
jgi:choline monooxygenase